MPIIIRCQDCAVLSVGKTPPDAITRFDELVGVFHGAEGVPGGAVGATETVVSDLDTRAWSTGSDALEGGTA